MSNEKSRHLFELAVKHIPGGVNSPVRAFKGVGGNPLFFKAGQDAYLIDADNNRYVDYVGAWGPLILGHCHEEVIEALRNQMQQGLAYGASTEAEVKMAEKICEIMPSIEKVRLVTSGTEATMSALRLARAHTGRDAFIKFDGCYHGHADSLLVKAGSGALTLGEPTSPGVPASLAALTLTARFNDLDSVSALFSEYGHDIACIIVEPVAGNMNCILPNNRFLQGLREICDNHQCLLIIDEVMTGFRVALGGAQEIYSVKPDLTTLGKIIGGGMPVGAFGGRQDVMEHLAPIGPVYQAGTLSGNPVAMAAGLACLKVIQQDGFYDELSRKTASLVTGLKQAAQAASIPMCFSQIGGMFGFFFTEESQINHFEQVTACDIERFQTFYHGMLSEGIYLAPSAYETGFMSMAHTQSHLDQTIEAAARVFTTL